MATKIIKGKKYAVATKISPFVDQILNDLKHQEKVYKGDLKRFATYLNINLLKERFP